MSDYKHYIEIDENNNVIDFFTSADRFKRNSSRKILIGTGRRQFNIDKHLPEGLVDVEAEDYIYKYTDGKIVKRDLKKKREEKKIQMAKADMKRRLKDELLEKLLDSKETDIAAVVSNVRKKLVAELNNIKLQEGGSIK